jgi:small-conductance mechanosensitive channel
MQLALGALVGFEVVTPPPGDAAPGLGITALILGTAFLFTILVRRASGAPALQRWQRWFSPLVVLVWLVSIWLVAARLLAGQDLATVAGRAALLVVLLVIAAPFARDVIAAAVISLEGRHRLRDDVRVAGVEGRIVEMGLRTVVLRGPGGTESTIPNHRFVAQEIDRLNLGAHDAPCEFEVALPAGQPLEAATRMLLEAALLSPFAAPGWLPEVFVVAGQAGELRLRVRAYVFDRSYEERYRGDVLARLEAAQTLPEVSASTAP